MEWSAIFEHPWDQCRIHSRHVYIFSSSFYQREKKINGQFRSQAIAGLGSDPDNAAAIYARGSLPARLFFFLFFSYSAYYLFREFTECTEMRYLTIRYRIVDIYSTRLRWYLRPIRLVVFSFFQFRILPRFRFWWIWTFLTNFIALQLRVSVSFAKEFDFNNPRSIV